ncbi:hypothetical protein QE152_g9875 [Popillia japonica]|uniref:Uncharacterized protein n=1 Tax=Popillia japonica TaxID=7064 RepID=A0AAW1LWG8_POPJA
MAGLVRMAVNKYVTVVDGLSDPRTTDWPLMSSPIPTIIMVLTYLSDHRLASNEQPNTNHNNGTDVLIRSPTVRTLANGESETFQVEKRPNFL